MSQNNFDLMKIDGFETGYRPDEEDWDFIDDLDEGVDEFDADDMMPMGDLRRCGALDIHTWMRIERQRMGSCNGHDYATISEKSYWDATGEIIQLSDLAGYYGAQFMDRGERPGTGDRGSTIAGGAKYVEKYGICDLEDMPKHYPYNWRRPPAAHEHRLVTLRRLKTYDDCHKWIQGGVGGIATGVPWSSTGRQAKVDKDYGGNSSWHSVPLLQPSWKYKDRDGLPYLSGPNSWGARWGDGGWFHWSPRYIRSILSRRHVVFIGVSDMAAVEPRKYDWLNEGW